MTKEEQRIAIAEACGWEAIALLGGEEEPEYLCGIVNKYPLRVPDYLNDLNAMHEAEKALDSDKRERYMTALAMSDPGHGSSSWYIVHLTAAQRAEAFLRTLGKWKE